MSVLTCSYRLHVEKKWNQSVASQIVLRDIIRKIFPIDVLRYMIWQCLWLMYCANWSGRLSERPQWMDCTIWETVCNWDSSLLTCSTKWCEKLCSVHVLHLLVYNVVLAAKVSCWSTSFLSHFFFFFFLYIRMRVVEAGLKCWIWRLEWVVLLQNTVFLTHIQIDECVMIGVRPLWLACCPIIWAKYWHCSFRGELK